MYRLDIRDWMDGILFLDNGLLAIRMDTEFA